MLFQPKVEVIPWRRSCAAKEVVTEVAVTRANFPLAWTVGATTLLTPVTVQAATDLTTRIARAFNPLIDLAQAVSYPICFLMATGSFLLIMTGNRERGLGMLKSAAVGYIGLQFVPSIMQILIEVGKAMRQP